MKEIKNKNNSKTAEKKLKNIYINLLLELIKSKNKIK